MYEEIWFAVERGGGAGLSFCPGTLEGPCLLAQQGTFPWALVGPLGSEATSEARHARSEATRFGTANCT